MHSFVVATAPNIPDTIDILHIQPSPSSIGIDAIRDIQNFLSKRPSQTETSVVFIHDAHTLTLPAQNAILKTLEEPPPYAHIYLITSQPDLLISTIQSRVQIQSSPSSDTDNHKNLSPEKNELITKFFNSNLSQKLLLLESQEFTRETALEFVSQLEHYLHNNLLQFNQPNKTYSTLEQTRKYLKSNCNLKLSLDYLSFSIISS